MKKAMITDHIRQQRRFLFPPLLGVLLTFSLVLSLLWLDERPAQADDQTGSTSGLLQQPIRANAISISITTAGFEPEVITILVASDVTWINQTATVQQLTDCSTAPPADHWLYLPLLFHLQGTPALSKTTAARQAATWSAQVIPPGQSYTEHFATPGQFIYCLASQPDASSTVNVVEAGKPDLTISTMTIDPPEPDINQPFTISLTLVNQGGEMATSFVVDWYAHRAEPPPLYAPGDLSWAVNSLSPAEVLTVSGVYSLSQMGAYTLYAQIDTAEAISETNETNNLSGPLSLIISPPLPISPYIDLVEGAEVTVGQLVTARLRYHPPGTYDIYFADQFMGMVVVDASGQALLPFTIPLTFGYQALESRETPGGNLVAFNTVHVGPGLAGPDLTITALATQPSPPVINQLTEILVRIENPRILTVTSPFSVDWYVNPSTPPVPGDPGNLSWTISQLTPMTALTLTTLYTPTTTGVQTFYAQIDTTAAIIEDDETNNLFGPTTTTVTIDLDVALVLDRSGSMEYDPVCYGCWERTETAANHQNDLPRWFGYYNYPLNGVIYPLGWNDNGGNPSDPVLSNPNIARACNPTPTPQERVYIQPTTTSPYYMIMEAELYGRNNSIIDPNSSEFGKGYWALQRGEGNYSNNDSAPPGPQYDYAGNYKSTGYSIDNRGAHMAAHPSLTSYGDTTYGRHYTLINAQNGDTPRLEYDFRFRNGGTIDWDTNPAYIWVRMHGGRGLDVDDNTFGDGLGGTDAYWTVVSEADDGNLAMDALDFNPNSVKPVLQITGPQTYNTIPNSAAWKWVRLEYPVPINTNDIYRLYIYAGSAGISLDRILVTNRSTTLPTLFDAAPDFQNPASQPQATAGSASRAACDPCNPIFGQNIGASGSADTAYSIDDCTFFQYNEPVDHRLDPLFGEWENLMRTAKEASKWFVTRLDPQRDQIGLVSFNDSSSPTKTFLECLRRYGIDICATPAYSYTQVLKDIEDVRARGGTNTGAGLKGGLEVLGFNVYSQAGALGTTCGGGTCVRGDASVQKVLILLTDGMPNANPGGVCRTAGPIWGDGSDQNANCPVYFAQQAAANGIRLYVIGLGYGVNSDYLQLIAELGQGQYYFSANSGDLDLIFNEILRQN